MTHIEKQILEKLTSLETAIQSLKAQPEPDEILNMKGACKLLHRKESNIYKHTMNGTIPFYKQGKTLYFRRSELIEWMTSETGHNAEEVEQEAIDRLQDMEVN